VLAYGIGGKVANWIENWLTNRRQTVYINGKFSNWKDVTSGVPQGSVLGPVLFLLYINDLDDNIESLVTKFADDTKLCRIVNGYNDGSLMQSDLDKIVQWSNIWQMSFNVKKCKTMHLGKRNIGEDYRMGDITIERTNQEKDLGILVDNTCKFSEQCTTAANSANRLLGMIKRNITYKSKNVILRLYKALVRPKLE